MFEWVTLDRSCFPRIKGDIVEIFEATHNQNLDKVNFEIDRRHAATIMLVSGGYPEIYRKVLKLKLVKILTNQSFFMQELKYQIQES